MPHPLSIRFDGCVARIERSREHLKALTEEILAVLAAIDRGEVCEIAGEFDRESGYETHRIKVLRPLPLARWGILVGDVVHQARAALDNLVELLNIRHSGHPLKKTEFPIYRDNTAYLSVKTAGFKKAGNVGRDAAALIESFQPYHRGDEYAADPLWMLHGLWIMDKHRNIPIVALVGETEAVVPKYRATSGTATFGRREILAPQFFPFHDGAEIGRFRIERSANAEVQMEHTLTLHITFGEGQPGARMHVASVLHACVDRTAEVLAQFEPFFHDPMCSC